MKNALQRGKKMSVWLSSFGLAVLALLMIWGQSYAKGDDRGYLGVYLEKLDDEMRESLKFKGEGIFVDDVVDDSPAEKAGLEEGDIILKFEDKGVKDVDELRELIGASKEGDKVAMVVFRDGKEIKLTAELGEAEDVSREIIIKRGMGRPGMMKMKGGCCSVGECNVWLGVEVQKLSDQLAEYFKVKDGKGVLVATVIKDAPAEKAGIKAGDVMVKIGDEEVSKPADLREAICGKKAGDEVAVNFLRDGQERTLKVALAEMPKERCEMKCFGGKGTNWFGPEGLDLEDIGPRIERHVRELPMHLEGSMEDMQKQLEQLKEELEKLKLKLENK
ncbi:MAG TPA: PDZ domain-containing protein [bacterium]|jgi:C-terminal processing protease CtpA/Prc